MEDKIRICKKCGSMMEEPPRKAPKYGEEHGSSGPQSFVMTSGTTVNTITDSSTVIGIEATILKRPIKIKRFICTNPNCRWEDQERENDSDK